MPALQRCRACAKFLHPVRSRCPACGAAEIEWAEASGRGRVWSHGRLRRSSLPEHEYERKLQLALGWVELDEGVRFASRLAAGDATQRRVGDRVAAVFERLADRTAVPVFAPAR